MNARFIKIIAVLVLVPFCAVQPAWALGLNDLAQVSKDISAGINRGFSRASSSYNNWANENRSRYAQAFQTSKPLIAGVNLVASALTGGRPDFYNSWTAQNRMAMPQLAAQWDHYTRNFGVAGAPLFVIGQVTNPILTRFTGIQPGSREAKQLGRDIYSWTGGIFNVPMKVLIGKDLSNPDSAQLQGWNRISGVTPAEALTYGLVVGSPLLMAAPGVISATGAGSWYAGTSTLNLAVNPTLNAALNIAGRAAVTGALHAGAANAGSLLLSGEPLSIEQSLAVFATGGISSAFSSAVVPMLFKNVAVAGATPILTRIGLNALRSGLTLAPAIGAINVDVSNALSGNTATYSIRNNGVAAPDLAWDLVLKPYASGAGQGFAFGAAMGGLGTASVAPGALAKQFPKAFKILNAAFGTSSAWSYLTWPAVTGSVRAGLGPFVYGEQLGSSQNVQGAFDWASRAFMARMFAANGNGWFDNKMKYLTGRGGVIAEGAEGWLGRGFTFESASHLSLAEQTGYFLTRHAAIAAIGAGAGVAKEVLLGSVLRPFTGIQVGTNVLEDKNAYTKLLGAGMEGVLWSELAAFASGAHGAANVYRNIGGNYGNWEAGAGGTGSQKLLAHSMKGAVNFVYVGPMLNTFANVLGNAADLAGYGDGRPDILTMNALKQSAVSGPLSGWFMQPLLTVFARPAVSTGMITADGAVYDPAAYHGVLSKAFGMLAPRSTTALMADIGTGSGGRFLLSLDSYLYTAAFTRLVHTGVDAIARTGVYIPGVDRELLSWGIRFAMPNVRNQPLEEISLANSIVKHQGRSSAVSWSEYVAHKQLVNAKASTAKISSGGEVFTKESIDQRLKSGKPLPGEYSPDSFKERIAKYRNVLGVDTFSGQGIFSGDSAMLRQNIDYILSWYSPSDTVVLGGLTNLGGVQVIYDEARIMGFSIAGIAATQALTSPDSFNAIRTADYICFISGDWGAESPLFLDLSTALLAYGGGGQAKKEILATIGSGKPIYAIQGIRNAQGSLGSTDNAEVVNRLNGYGKGVVYTPATDPGPDL